MYFLYSFATVLFVALTTLPVAAFSAPASGLSKVEAAGVQRFKRFDKLCKTCPTLLQPAVATLEEMIMGLSTAEREALLANVARRIQQEEKEGTASSDTPRIRTAEDVYKFQTGAEATIEAKMPAGKKDELKEPKPKEAKRKESTVDSRAKLLGKIEKARSKFEANKLKLARLQCLLEHTNRLLSGNDKAVVTDTTIDSTVYHCVDELQEMSREELKMQRLKFMAQKIKYEQKLAKNRVKLYEASLKFAEEQNERTEPAVA